MTGVSGLGTSLKENHRAVLQPSPVINSNGIRSIRPLTNPAPRPVRPQVNAAQVDPSHVDIYIYMTGFFIKAKQSQFKFKFDFFFVYWVFTQIQYLQRIHFATILCQVLHTSGPKTSPSHVNPSQRQSGPLICIYIYIWQCFS